MRFRTIAIGLGLAVIISVADAPRAPGVPEDAAGIATAASVRQAGSGQLAGKWRREDARGDRNYWLGEYPDMTLEIRVQEDVVAVRQALGRVRNGVALAGSGEEFHEYALTLDGVEHEIATPNASRRLGTARWDAGALRIDSTWTMDGADDPITVRIDETWTVLDGGATLQIHRFVEVQGRDRREATVVFTRVD
jgi:hypothetical protein